MKSVIETGSGQQTDASEKGVGDEAKHARVSRRRFMRNAASGVAGAAFTLSGAGELLAAAKDSGEIVLDGLMMTYVAAPPAGRNTLTPETAYTMTLGLRSRTHPEISLRARVSPNQEKLRIVRQARSEEVRNGIVVFARPKKNESFSVTSTGGMPENATFFGLCFPRLRLKGNGNKVNFRLVEAECLFIRSAGQLASDDADLLSRETARSMLAQYVFDPAQLTEPRFVLVQSLNGGEHTLTRRAESGEPEDITSTVTARIIEQTGFSSDVLKEAFAVGSDLELTYHSAQDSRGRLLMARLDLDPASRHDVYWDRIFKTFVLAENNL